MTTKVKRSVSKKQREQIINDAPRFIASFQPGDVSAQGDLLIVCLPKLPESAKPRINRQLAEGSTQGSRHILERGDVYDCDASRVAAMIRKLLGVEIATAYLGPVFVSPANPTANDLTHPEHGNQGFQAGAVCAVVYQRSLDAEEREARVRD